MIITYDGQKYPFDLDDVTVKQVLKIEKFMGCSYAEWGKKLEPAPEGEEKDVDMRAIQAVGWLILHQGDTVAIEDTDFKLNVLRRAIEEAAEAELAAAAVTAKDEPVPTGAASTGLMPEAASSPVS